MEWRIEELTPLGVVGVNFVDGVRAAIDGPAFVGPGEDGAFEIHYVGVAGLLQLFRQRGGP